MERDIEKFLDRGDLLLDLPHGQAMALVEYGVLSIRDDVQKLLDGLKDEEGYADIEPCLARINEGLGICAEAIEDCCKQWIRRKLS